MKYWILNIKWNGIKYGVSNTKVMGSIQGLHELIKMYTMKVALNKSIC